MSMTANPSVTVERRSLETDLSRLARVVEGDAGSARCSGCGFEHAQPFFLGDARLDAAEDPHRVALLEPVQGARRRARFDVRERRDRHELAARGLDLEIEQRTDRRAVFVADLRE